MDLKPNGIDGARVQNVLDEVHITLNKNSVPGDKSAMVPGGMRIGTPALTTRGFKEADFVKVREGREGRGSLRYEVFGRYSQVSSLLEEAAAGPLICVWVEGRNGAARFEMSRLGDWAIAVWCMNGDLGQR